MSPIAPLVALRFRRDRVQLPMWILGTVLLAISAQAGVASSYISIHDRTALLATVAANPVILLFRGLPSGAEANAFALFLILPWLLITAALMSVFFAVRHTRAEEESGRAELVGGTVAGRNGTLTATVIAGIAANALLGAILVTVYAALGTPLGGAAIVGAATMLVGIVFLGVALCAAQVLHTARGANALAVWVLLAAFLGAGIGNAMGRPSSDLTRIDSAWPNGLSPFGWAEQTRPFADDAPLPLLWCGLLGVALIAGSYALHAARDFDGAMIPRRRAREHPGIGLGSPLGLAWRLSRGSLAGWTIAGFLTGLLSTSLGAVVKQASSGVQAVDRVLASLSGGEAMETGLVVIFFLIVGLLAACSGVQTVSRARQEEARGTAELVLSTAVGRVRWLASFVIVATIGVLAVVAGAVAGAAAGVARSGSTGLVRDAAIAGLGQAVAALAFVAFAAVLFVLLPRVASPVAWALVVLALCVGLFAPVLGAPEWVAHLSPFAEAPVPTASGVDLRGAAWLGAAALVGGAAALALMRRRELASA